MKMKIGYRLLICGGVSASLLLGGVKAQGEEQSSVEVAKAGDLYTLKAQDASLSSILSELEKQSSVKLAVDPRLLDEKLTLDLADVSYEDIVEKLAGSHALIYEKNAAGEYLLISARLTGQQDYIAPELDGLSRRERRNVSEKAAQIKKIIGQIQQIYGFAGELDYEAAKKLSAERDARFQELVQQLIDLGPGGARAMNNIYGENPGTREKMAMIEALAYIDDADAANVLGQLFSGESKYSMQREMIGSLGRRSGPEVSALLNNILDSQKDKRLRAAATQAMAGRPESIDTLTSLVGSPGESPDVKSEAIRSIGLIKNDPAMNALTQVASSSSYDLALRKTAIQELGRSFGGSALASLSILIESPEESIRQSVVRSLSRVDTKEALDLLGSIAENDTSAIVRSHAQAAITAVSTAAPVSAN